MKSLAAKVLAVLIGVVFPLVSGPAHGAQLGPTKDEPSTTSLTRSEAHKAARAGWGTFMVATLPNPRTGSVQPCTGGPRVWRCKAFAKGGPTKCHATVLVWASESMYYYQWANLACKTTRRPN